MNLRCPCLDSGYPGALSTWTGRPFYATILPISAPLFPMLLEGNPMAAILVVDDDPDTRSLLTDILTPEGHTVHPIANGLEASDLVRRQSFDLALVDLWLPGLNGLDLVQRLRETAPGLPLMLLTARPAICDWTSSTQTVTGPSRRQGCGAWLSRKRRTARWAASWMRFVLH